MHPQQAIEFAFRTYNESPERRQSSVEFGHVLYVDRSTDDLLPGPLVISPSSESVDLYEDLVTKLRVIDGDREFSGAYWGDYHAHPVGSSWLSQFPSPQDVTSVSVTNDLWPNGNGTLLYKAPTIQVVQSLLFGDLFVISPVQGRTQFASFDEQEAEVEKIFDQYYSAHRKQHDIHGFISSTNSPRIFDNIVSKVLPKLNPALRGRAHIQFVRNAVWREALRKKERNLRKANKP